MTSFFEQAATERLAPVKDTDFQTLRDRPRRDQSGDVERAILILTRTGDKEADQLSLYAARRGVPLRRVNSDCLPEHITLDLSTRLLSLNGKRIEPLAVWVRYFDPSSIRLHTPPDLLHFARESWAEFAAAVIDVFASVAINSAATPFLHRKMRDLRSAAAVGLQVPQTFISNRPDLTDLTTASVLKACGSHFAEPCPGRRLLLLPQLVGGADLMPEPAPVTAQPYHGHSGEIRAFVVDELITGFELPGEKPSPSIGGSARVVHRELPHELAAKLIQLSRNLALDVAAFDLLIIKSGFVFLEANPTCDWVWFENMAGVSIVTKQVLDLVERRAETWVQQDA